MASAYQKEMVRTQKNRSQVVCKKKTKTKMEENKGYQADFENQRTQNTDQTA